MREIISISPPSNREQPKSCFTDYRSRLRDTYLPGAQLSSTKCGTSYLPFGSRQSSNWTGRQTVADRFLSKAPSQAAGAIPQVKERISVPPVLKNQSISPAPRIYPKMRTTGNAKQEVDTFNKIEKNVLNAENYILHPISTKPRESEPTTRFPTIHQKPVALVNHLPRPPAYPKTVRNAQISHKMDASKTTDKKVADNSKSNFHLDGKADIHDRPAGVRIRPKPTAGDIMAPNYPAGALSCKTMPNVAVPPDFQNMLKISPAPRAHKTTQAMVNISRKEDYLKKFYESRCLLSARAPKPPPSDRKSVPVSRIKVKPGTPASISPRLMAVMKPETLAMQTKAVQILLRKMAADTLRT